MFGFRRGPREQKVDPEEPQVDPNVSNDPDAGVASEANEYNEDESFAAGVVRELRQNEEDRSNERWGGPFGKMNKYLVTTRLGRWINTTGKIVLGTGIAAGAATLSGPVLGPASLIAAPIAYAFGKRTVIDGAIEGIQGLVKGNRLRISLEGKKQDQILMEDALLGLEEQWLNKEITEEEYWDSTADLVKDIRETESQVIESETSNEKWEKGQKLLRGIASSLGTVALGYLQGVPLGMQNFDGKGLDHLVKLSRNGFDFIYNLHENVAQTVHSVWGQTAHAMGEAIPKEGLIGLGTAMVGLFAKPIYDFVNWRRSGRNENSPSGDPAGDPTYTWPSGDPSQDPYSQQSQQPGPNQHSQDPSAAGAGPTGPAAGSQTSGPSAGGPTPGGRAAAGPDAGGQADPGEAKATDPNPGGPKSKKKSSAGGAGGGAPGAGGGSKETKSGAQEKKKEGSENKKKEPSYSGDPFAYEVAQDGHGDDINAINAERLQNNIERILYHTTLSKEELEKQFGRVESPNALEVRKLLVLPNKFSRKMLGSRRKKALGFCHPENTNFIGNPKRQEMANMLFQIINNGAEELGRNL